MADSAIITSLCWVSRGFAKAVVDEYEPTAKELKAFTELNTKVYGTLFLEISDKKELTS